MLQKILNFIMNFEKIDLYNCNIIIHNRVQQSKSSQLLKTTLFNHGEDYDSRPDL
jgi:hypothetical protein